MSNAANNLLVTYKIKNSALIRLISLLKGMRVFWAKLIDNGCEIDIVNRRAWDNIH